MSGGDDVSSGRELSELVDVELQTVTATPPWSSQSSIRSVGQFTVCEPKLRRSGTAAGPKQKASTSAVTGPKTLVETLLVSTKIHLKP